VSALAEEERRIHKAQIEKLEEELRKAKEAAEYGERESNEGETRKQQKRDRSMSQDSKQESTVSSTVGANMLNLP
jgi:hypothetical protein